MTDPTRPPDDAARTDAAQADALDRYLDALARGERPRSSDLDPTLASTVRRAHALGDDGVRTITRRAGKARRWETIMRDLTRYESSRPRTIASQTMRVLPSLGSGADERGPWPPEQDRFTPGRRWGLLSRRPSAPADTEAASRRIPGGPLGLVATLALVLVIAASGLAVMLTAPGGGGEPTMLPAAFGATPAATPSLTFPPAEYAFGSPRLLRQPCVTPETRFADVMDIIAQQYASSSPGNHVDTSQLQLPLPDGPTPDSTLVDDLASIYAQYRACDRRWLRLASLGTDAGIVRLFSFNYGDYQGLLDGQLIAEAWNQQSQEVLGETGIGQPDLLVLLGLRYLPDGRIAGYLTESFSITADGTVSLAGQPQLYIVFAQQEGRWLLDDFMPPGRG